MKQPHIVVIGGGTGSFTLLRSLKKYSTNVTALVNMADDGGSTGVLRDELGVLPPGDIRQCLVALSEAPEELRELFNFRFATGTFEGHSFGNIFLSAVEKMTDNFDDAVRMASDVLRITGRVVPMTLDNHQLVLDKDGAKITGEFAISKVSLNVTRDTPNDTLKDEPSERLTGQYKIVNTHLKDRPQLSLSPAAGINPVAKQAILDADLVVIAPGNLYGSIIPALLVDGVSEALQQTVAKVAFVCNLVNKAKQTPDYYVHDYVDEIERFAGAGSIDFALYNTDIPDDSLLERYALDGEYPVLYDTEKLSQAPYEAIPGSFLSRAEHARNPNDTRILRSLIRHDGEAIAKTLLSLI
jgi:2-phospho-L-lactate transferase/gluconeogenesis factor (CofD/UPF0052 family)